MLEFELDENLRQLAPDLAAVYSVVAPLVTEAAAYFESGNADSGMATLLKARDIIHFQQVSIGLISLDSAAVDEVRTGHDADSCDRLRVPLTAAISSYLVKACSE